MFISDTSGRLYVNINPDYGLEVGNYKIRLITEPYFIFNNQKLALNLEKTSYINNRTSKVDLKYNKYFKITNNELDTDKTELQKKL